MTLTNNCFESERGHLGGVQRMYKLPNGYGLSLVNAAMLHSYPFAWEAAVFYPKGGLAYNTPLTSDVEVFYTDEQANDFIARAIAWAETAPVEST